MEEEDDETKIARGVVEQKSTRIQSRTQTFSSTSYSTTTVKTSSTRSSFIKGTAMSEPTRKICESEESSEKTSVDVATSSVSKSLEDDLPVIPMCQIITHQASNESEESGGTISETDIDGHKITKTFHQGILKDKTTSRYSDQRFSAKLGLFSRSATSSSSQEEYEPEIKLFGQKTISSTQFLTTGRVEATKSMESLRVAKENTNQLSVSSEKTLHAHRGSFLTSSERDMRKVLTTHSENRSFDSYDRDIRLKRRALSGEEMGGSMSREETVQITAEKRRGLFAGVERRSTPQHLSLPPSGGPFFGMGSSQDSSRKLMILSPHSPLTTPDLLNFTQPSLGIKGRRKKGMVLPKLILPRSDSEASEVFFDHNLLE